MRNSTIDNATSIAGCLGILLLAVVVLGLLARIFGWISGAW